MAANKYSKFFNENMSRVEAGYQYFALYDDAKEKGELELLEEAYYPIVEIIISRDLALASEDCMC